MKNIIDQLARTALLPDGMSATILAGKTPPIEDVLMHVLIAVQDAHAVLVADPRSTQSEKRLGRMALAVAFLAGMAVVGRVEP